MNKKEILRASITLAVVCLLAGLLLAEVNNLTKDKIAQQEKKEEKTANLKIFPTATEFKEEPDRVVVYQDNEELGTIYKGETKGYGGPIVFKFGLNKENRLVKVIILQQNETPGLGTQIVEKEWFLKQFEGLSAADIYLKKDKSQGKIDAVTGATISSRALTEGLRKYLEEKINEN